MPRVDLMGEFKPAVRACTDADVARFEGLGLPCETLPRLPIAGIIGAAHVRPGSDGLYEPTEGDGIRAWTFPTALVGELHEPEIEDLLAVAMDRPDRWRLRLGEGEMLGQHEIERRRFGCARRWHRDLLDGPTDDPLHVWRSPLAWLRAGARGVCVLRWTAGAIDDLGSIWSPIAAEDVEHGVEIRRHLTEPSVPIPEILIPDNRRVAA
jgi:hypothetical protein